MKRAYHTPTLKYIDYSYDEQVVAESSKIDGKGDGFQVHYCTWESASFSDPCLAVLASNPADRPTSNSCQNFNPWSLRG